ncbi:MAG: hypothetical protein IOC90_02010 [Methylocystis sp.]|nr:hypothetical protein [Methylocystis sp.]MCA3584127.1 hypothetical protein [Methylocystis sp.]MCA3586800.1 hypothetical protein [Methylocystis sp.]MCA3591247.1 hypothetical protein [Methylocystis sp.]
MTDNHPEDAVGPLVKGYMLLMLARRELRAGRMGETVALLAPLRPILHHIGGSHAQRGVFEQIYVEALVRSGAAAAEPVLTNRRDGRGGQSRFAEQRLSRALGATARSRAALDALSLTPVLQAH